MKKICLALFICVSTISFTQPLNYTSFNAHSHNDYEQLNPFYEAWQNNFGSIEADIFLYKGKLLVAHEAKELNNHRTLESLYLKPLIKVIKQNYGNPYADTGRQLQLMIDVKTDSVATLKKLVKVLKKYPGIINCANVKVVISGNRPLPEYFTSYPSFIYFDGVLSKTYPDKALSKIVMLSDNFHYYSKWNDLDTIAEYDKKILNEAVKKAHALQKKVRFWNAPDNENAWQTFIQLQVDYINTDHIQQLAAFLKLYPH